MDQWLNIILSVTWPVLPHEHRGDFGRKSNALTYSFAASSTSQSGTEHSPQYCWCSVSICTSTIYVSVFCPARTLRMTSPSCTMGREVDGMAVSLFQGQQRLISPSAPPDRARPSGSLSSRGGEPSLEWRGKRNVALWSLHPVSHGTQSPATPPPTLGSGSTPDLGHSGLGHGGGTVVLLFGLTLLRNNSEIEWASCGLQRRHTTIICHYWICVRVLINKAI